MKWPRTSVVLRSAALVAGSACQSRKTTRKVTIEGPEKKHEVKIETTEKDDD